MARTSSFRIASEERLRHLATRSLAAAGIAAVAGLTFAAAPAMADARDVAPVLSSTVAPEAGPFTGHGVPHHHVTLSRTSGGVVCHATVNAEGRWACSPASPLRAGVTQMQVHDNVTHLAGYAHAVRVACPPPVPVANPLIAAAGVALALGAGAVVIRRRATN